jgi:hypothetical protein
VCGDGGLDEMPEVVELVPHRKVAPRLRLRGRILEKRVEVAVFRLDLRKKGHHLLVELPHVRRQLAGRILVRRLGPRGLRIDTTVRQLVGDALERLVQVGVQERIRSRVRCRIRLEEPAEVSHVPGLMQLRDHMGDRRFAVAALPRSKQTAGDPDRVSAEWHSGASGDWGNRP